MVSQNHFHWNLTDPILLLFVDRNGANLRSEGCFEFQKKCKKDLLDWPGNPIVWLLPENSMCSNPRERGPVIMCRGRGDGRASLVLAKENILRGWSAGDVRCALRKNGSSS